MTESNCEINNVILKDTVSKAIMKLNVLDREIIILHYYQELSLKEISSMIGKSENAVNQRLFRARKKLKSIMEEAGL